MGDTRLVSLESGHAPGKDGVGERGTIEKEKGDKERIGGQRAQGE